VRRCWWPASRGGSAWAVGPTAWGLSFFVLGNSLRRELKVPLGPYPPRVSTHTLGEGSFAGTVLPRGLHREHTLYEGFGEMKGSFAERNPTLGETLESCSVSMLSEFGF
jgi:hypothetical protein